MRITSNTMLNLLIYLVFIGAILAVVIYSIVWRRRICTMMKMLAEARGYKGDAQIFEDAVMWTGVLGAMTVLAMPDQNLRREVKELREEVKALREELAEQKKM